MTDQEITKLVVKLILEKRIIKTSFPERPSGGQHAGIAIPGIGIKLSCPEIGFEIAISYHRSQIRNIEEATAILKNFLKKYNHEL